MTTGKLFEYKTCAPSGGYAAFAREWVLLPVDHARLAQRQHAPVMTWLGPVSMLLQVGGLNILLDHAGRLCWALWPLWRTAPGTPAPLAPEELPPIDVVLISHNHYDHLCDDTIGRLLAAGHQPRFFVPLGLKPWFDTRNIAQLTELDWWDRAQINDGLQLHFTPSQHWSRRTPWDTNASLWGGYLLEWTLEEAEPWRFLFPGDTGYSADFKAIRTRLGAVDFLALPIGAYLPRDFMKNMHVNPADAVQLMLDVEAKQAMGVHWGTFMLTQEAFDHPPRDLAIALRERGLPQDSVWLMRQGETRAIPLS